MERGQGGCCVACALGVRLCVRLLGSLFLAGDDVREPYALEVLILFSD